MRRLVLGCLVLLAASPAFGYLVDLRAIGSDPECVTLNNTAGPRSFQIQMYIDTQSTDNSITCSSAESRIATVGNSSGTIAVPDVLDIIGPDAIPKTFANGSLNYYTYPQYSTPTWFNRSSQLGPLPLPKGRVNFDQTVPSAHADHNWSTGRLGSIVNSWIDGGGSPQSYIYGRVLLATFTVQLKDGYSGPYSNDCQHPSFYVVSADATIYSANQNPNTQNAYVGQKIGVCVTPEPATALLLLAAVPFLRRRR